MRLIATTLILLVACGGNGKSPTVDAVAQLEECLGTGLDNLLGGLGGLSPLLAVASDPESAGDLGVTWTEATPTVFNFTAPVDLDGDGTPDGQMQGSATFDRAPAGGLMLDDVVHLSWDLSGHPSVTGEGDLDLRLSATGLEVWGDLGFAERSGDCSFDFTAEENAPLLIEIPGVWPPAPAATYVYGNLTIDLTGAGALTVTWNGNTLTANVSYPTLGNWVDVTNIRVTVAGVVTSRPDARLDIGDVPNNTVGIDLWLGTWDNRYSASSFITQNTIEGTETYVITLGAPGTLNIAVHDDNDNLDYSFVLTLDPGSDTKGTFTTSPQSDGHRYHAGSGQATVEERGTLQLFIIPEAPPRILKESSHGIPGFDQNTVEGFGSLISSVKR